jgi:endo-1,4-beta-xylanase
MSEGSRAALVRAVSRRSFLGGSAAVLACGPGLGLKAMPVPTAQLPNTSALKRAAQYSGKTLGMFTVAWELQHDHEAAAIIANTFSMIADGNDLKFADYLRPTPTTYDFSYGDTAVSWAEQHGLLFRAHCLVWWNALPKWFDTYVTTANAKQVMVEHIKNVVGHYAGRVYSWDVVNEPLADDNRNGGLRVKPWLNLVGPDYIDIAFRTAHAADPQARLVLNECYIEHNTPLEIGRRACLLALAQRLKKSGVPVTTLGLQSHLRGDTPLDKHGMVTFLKRVQDLGLDIFVTELDVEDYKVPGPLIDQTVADKYGEYLELVTPYAKVITFEQLRDDPSLPKRPDGLAHRPNLFDEAYQPSQAYRAVVHTLANSHAAFSASLGK